MSRFNKPFVLFLMVTISCSSKPMEPAAPANKLTTLENCPAELSKLLYSSNGAFAVGYKASGDAWHLLNIWNGETRAAIWNSQDWQYDRKLCEVYDFAIDPQNTNLAVVGRHISECKMVGCLAILDIATGIEKLFLPYGDKDNRAISLAYNNGGTHIAIGTSNTGNDKKLLKIVDSVSGKTIREKSVGEVAITALSYSPNGNLLGIATASNDSHPDVSSKFFLLDLVGDKIVKEFDLKTKIHTIQFCGETIIITSYNKCLLFNIATQGTISIDPEKDFWFSQACLLKKRKQLLLGKMPAKWENKGPENARYVNVVDILTGNIVTSWGERPVSAMAVDPNTDETIVVTSSRYHEPVSIFNLLNKN